MSEEEEKKYKKPLMGVLHCVICDKDLEAEYWESTENEFPGIVYDGIICRSTGNYGSTIFDPLHDNEELRFVVCDECLDAKSHFFTILYNFSRPRPAYKTKSYKVQRDNEKADSAWWEPIRDLLISIFGDNGFKVEPWNREDLRVCVLANHRDLFKELGGFKPIGWVTKKDEKLTFTLSPLGRAKYDILSEKYPDFKKYFETENNNG